MTQAVLKTPIAVIGSGSWGTALALLLARKGQTVRLWGNDPAQIKSMQLSGVNLRYLPTYVFPENLTPCLALEEALAGVEDVLVVVPSHGFKTVLQQAKPYFSANLRLVWGSKGLDPERCQTLHEVAQEVLGEQVPLAILSGPSFANEVAGGLPTAVTVASKSAEFIDRLFTRFGSDVFRLYRSDDVIGVELCGVVKNVLAIATGLCDGLGWGVNTRSALITRGMAELSRLLTALGGNSQTLLSLAGVGDIILTCTNDQSRNRRFGLAIGKGKPVSKALEIVGQVVEGYINSKQLYQLAQQHQVDMPIVATLYHVLYEKLGVKRAAKQLLSRDLGQWG